MNGILLIDKEEGFTSRDVVNIVSKKLKTKKVGHTGTLDPIATGVLVLCVGKATKLVEIITNDDKEYIATVVLGIKTDTLDITGKILQEKNVEISEVAIKDVLNNFKGEYLQEVPIYSAVKIKGRKLYEYARNNEVVELPKRKVIIKEIKLVDKVIYENNKTLFKFKVLVSKGTYVRSLINDIASKLNTIGTMKSLVRTKQGNFLLENCIKLNEINETINLIDIKEALKSFYIVEVDQKMEYKLLHGQIIDNVYNKKEVLFTNYRQEIIAIYHQYDKEKNKLKPWKMFK